VNAAVLAQIEKVSPDHFSAHLAGDPVAVGAHADLVTVVDDGLGARGSVEGQRRDFER
jgi:hypothetical protein